MDDVRFYDRALSADDISQRMPLKPFRNRFLCFIDF